MKDCNDCVLIAQCDAFFIAQTRFLAACEIDDAGAMDGAASDRRALGRSISNAIPMTVPGFHAKARVAHSLVCEGGDQPRQEDLTAVVAASLLRQVFEGDSPRDGNAPGTVAAA